MQTIRGTIGAVALVTFLLYIPAMKNGFVAWDDHLYVYENPQVIDAGIDLVRWAFTSFHAHNWHPLTWLSHGLDVLLWNLNAAGHHATSILIHAVNTSLVMVLVIMLAHEAEDPLRRKSLGAAGYPVMLVVTAGLLFGLHPVHVEPVVWISERKELLSTMFYLLGLIAYVRFCRDSAGGEAAGTAGALRSLRAGLWVALVLFVLALLSKPMAVTFPLVLLLLDWFPLRRMRTRRDAVSLVVEKLPLFALSALSSVVTILAQQRAIDGGDAIPLAARLCNVPVAVVRYLGKLVVPFDLIPFYPHPWSLHPDLLSGYYLLPAALLALAAAGVLLSRIPLLIASGVFLAITLLPVIGIVQVGGHGMADRYLYLPGIGPIALIAAGVQTAWDRLSRDRPVRTLQQALVLVLLGGYFLFSSVLTVRQIGHWRNSVSLWDHELSVVSDAKARPTAVVSFALANRGKGRLDQGDPAGALQDFSAAIAIRPGWHELYTGRGAAYIAAGHVDLAIEDLNRSIAIRPDLAAPYIIRARVHAALKRDREAIRDYTSALEREAGRSEIYFNRGNAYARTGDYPRAVEDFTQAISRSSRPHPDHVANRDKAIAAMGRTAERKSTDTGRGQGSSMP